MATTTERGYGWQHQQIRKALLAVYHPAQPCPRCGQPLGLFPELLDLGHVDGDKSRYSGLEHARCNRQAGAKFGNLLRGRDGSSRRRRPRRWAAWPPPEDPPRRSRRW